MNVKNRYIYKLCSDENFWRERTFQKFGKVEKNNNRDWKRFYLKIVYYNDKYDRNSEKILDELSQRGTKDLDLINYFLQIYLNEIKKYKLVFGFVFEAAKYHNIDLVKYYLKIARKHFSEEEYEDILGHAAVGAAASGNKELFKSMIAEGFDDFEYALHTAAKYGQLDMVKFLYSLGARNNRSVENYIALGVKQGYMTRERSREIVEFLDQDILKRARR